MRWHMKIKEIMGHEVITCTDTSSLADAVKQFWEHDIGFLPVVSAQTGQMCGVLTDRDAAICAYFEGKPLRDIQVSKAMSSRVISVSPEDEIGDVEGALAQAQVHRVPVVEQGKIVGIVSINDIARQAAASFDARLEEEVALTLGAITAPRQTILH